MKKAKKWMIGLVVALCLLGIGLAWMASRNLSFSVGRCIIADSGQCLLVMDNSPVALANRTGKDDAYAGFRTGDKLFVLHDGINESYPGSTGAYFVMWLGDGSEADVPADILAALEELGWIE